MDQLILKADINQCEFSGQINTGEVEARTLTVEMCDRLCSCAMAFVTFELADGTMYESKVTDGKAKVPLFKKSQFIKVGLYSADIEGEECIKRYSPKPANAYVNVGSYKEGSSESPKPTPGDYAELIDQIAGVKKDTAESLADLEKGTIKSVENVKLWELETGYYYISGTLGVSTTEQVTYTKPHLYIVYKLFQNQVRYIHLCADSQVMTWAPIEVGYSSNNSVGHKEYMLMDTSRLVTEINKYCRDDQFPSAKSVYKFVTDYVNEQIATDEDIMEAMTELGMITPITLSNGSILTANSGAIYTL